jgi:hypothetical protein
MRATTMIAVPIFVWTLGSASAETAGTLKVKFGNATDVFVLRGAGTPKHPNSPNFNLEPFDTIQIRTNAATVEITLLCAGENDGGNKPCSKVILDQPHSAYIIPPVTTSVEEAVVLQPFFQQTLGEPTEGIAGVGVTKLPRSTATSALVDRLTIVKNVGNGAIFDVPVTGSLRSLPSLGASQDFLLAGAKGLALAWAGGIPPYSVATEITASGDPLGEAESRTPFAWWPDWRMPGEQVTVTITDASGQTLQGRLLPASALPSGQSTGSTTAVIRLFEAGDGWRLEALRRLAALPASDTLAAQALAAIRLSATEE